MEEKEKKKRMRQERNEGNRDVDANERVKQEMAQAVGLSW